VLLNSVWETAKRVRTALTREELTTEYAVQVSEVNDYEEELAVALLNGVKKTGYGSAHSIYSGRHDLVSTQLHLKGGHPQHPSLSSLHFDQLATFIYPQALICATSRARPTCPTATTI
jgi:hypothetical protein